MKICIVLGNYHSFGMGGSEIQAHYLAEYLGKVGVEVDYVFHGEKNSLTPVIEGDNFRLFQVNKPYRGMRPLNYLNRGFIFKLLDKISPDLIYCRGNLDFSDIISVYSKKRKIPLVYGIASDIQCRRRRVRKNGMFLIDILNKIFGERFYDRVDQFVLQTEHQRSLLSKNFGKKGIVIRNGHPVESVNNEKDDPPRIIWIGNIKDIKQPMIFVDLAERFSGRNFIFTMIGRSDDDALLGRLVKRIDSINNIEYLGELDLQEANNLLERSTVLVNTSIFEGFSNTFIQAWLRKTPVISLNSDPDGILEKERIGRRSDTLDRLTDHLSTLLSDPDELKSMGERAREYAVKNHDFQAIGARYLELFKGIVE